MFTNSLVFTGERQAQLNVYNKRRYQYAAIATNNGKQLLSYFSFLS